MKGPSRLARIRRRVVGAVVWFWRFISSSSALAGILRGVVGAVVGGIVGYYAYVWMLGYGLYAIILPGTLVGLGFGLCCRQKCVVCGIACGVVGVALGVFSEWRIFPFIEDDSFAFFVTHLHQLRPATLLLIGLGGLFSFWFGVGRDAANGRRAGRGTSSTHQSDPPTGEE